MTHRTLASPSRFLFVVCVLLALSSGCDETTPPLAQPSSMAPIMGSTRGGDRVAILGEAFLEGSVVLFDGVPAGEVQILRGVMTVVTPAHVEGEVAVTIHDPVGRTIAVPGAFTYQQVASTEGRPHVVGAASTGNTGVRIFFSEPLRPGAEEPGNYLMAQPNVNSEAAALMVLGGVLAEDGLSVELVTNSQNEVTYEVTVSGVRDLDGNPLAPPELLIDPTRALFAGTPPDASGTLVDADGDGLPDHVEQGGWVTTVQLSNGEYFQRIVTSDLALADTDGDGLSDAREFAAGTNPRVADTDGDTIPDLVEVDTWHSSPVDQDSDDDRLADATELMFGTAPILDDTDGDGTRDRDELFLLNRNPLLADLPKLQIVVGEYSLQVSVTSSFTDETGTTHAVQSSVSSSVSQSMATSLGKSDTRSTESTNKTSQTVGGEVGYSTKDGFGGKITFSAGFEQSNSRGYSSTVDSTTARESQQSAEQSRSQAMEASELRSVTRSIDAAQLLATVNVANSGAVPFTLTNLEISVLRQDRATGGAYRPVATLRPNDDLSLNMGPFDSERGPLIFENATIFPNVVEDLLREPSGLIFKVANYDVLDANGQNFAFSSATINSRTAGLTFDYGDGRVESYRVATHAAFGPDGLPQGATIARALELVGLTLTPDDAVLPDPVPSPLPQALQRSVGTLVDDTGVERLVRVRGVQNDLRGLASPEKRFWTLHTNHDEVTPDLDFSSLRVRAGREYLFVYTRDLDQDGLHELEEFSYGSSDASVDTDGDGLTDAEEVRVGWTVRVSPGSPRTVFSSPARADSDLDGLTDAEERFHGTDPNRADTDGDGLPDLMEIRDTFDIALADGDEDAFNNPSLVFAPYSDATVLASFDGTVSLAAIGDDVQVAQVGAPVTAGEVVILPGTNGIIDTVVPPGALEVLLAVETIVPGIDGVCDLAAVAPDLQVTPVSQTPAPGEVCIRPGAPTFVLATPTPATHDDYLRVAHARLFATDPTRADTDFDGIPDGRETRVGINPNTRDASRVLDSDNDGLTDGEEDLGWTVCLNGSATDCVLVTSDKLNPDTDRDGIPDVFEFAVGSNPRARDTDADGLMDADEFEVGNSFDYYAPNALATAQFRCLDAPNCSLPETTPSKSNLLAVDSDGDERSDFAEVRTSWVVHGQGGPVVVFSSPNLADEDVDGLDDLAELARLTHPQIADTDGDGTFDGVEVGQGGGRDPLVVDQRVTLTGITTWVQGDCDPDSDGGQFEGGDITLWRPDTSSNMASFSSCKDVDEPGGSQTGRCAGYSDQGPFILKADQGFTITSAPLKEVDDAAADEHLGTLDNRFDYKLSTGSHTLTVNKNGDTSCQVSLTFNLNAD